MKVIVVEMSLGNENGTEKVTYDEFLMYVGCLLGHNYVGGGRLDRNRVVLLRFYIFEFITVWHCSAL